MKNGMLFKKFIMLMCVMLKIICRKFLRKSQKF